MAKNHIIRIAAADDHQIILDSIRFAIEMHRKGKMELVISVKTGKDLFAELEKKKAHVLILDLQMPDIYAEKTCRMLREKYPEMKIIILTFHRGWHEANSFIKAGASGFVTKDFGWEKTIDAVEAVMRGEIYLCNKEQDYLEVAPQKQKLKQVKRENKILEMLVLGNKNTEMARQLNVSVKTIEADKRALFKKTGCENSLGLVGYALGYGLVKKKTNKKI